MTYRVAWPVGLTSILRSDGWDDDVELGEPMNGEKKEMLIELELDNIDLSGDFTGRASGKGQTLSTTGQMRFGAFLKLA